MVNQNQIEHARILVETSPNLSDAERAEWLSLLPLMSDKQLLELCTVLEPKPELPEAPVVKRIPVQTAARLGAAPPELDLPAPAQKPEVVTPAAGTSQNSVSAFLDRNFATTLHRSPVADIAQPSASGRTVLINNIPVTAPVRAEQKAVLQVERVENPQTLQQPVVAAPVETQKEFLDTSTEVLEQVRSLEDMSRINLVTLQARGMGFVQQAFAQLAQRFGYFSVQLAFERSPLYKTYLAVGARILREHVTFEALEAELVAAGKAVLRKQDFEALSDFLQQAKSN